MGPQMQLMRMRGPVRTAASLLRGMNVSHTDSAFKIEIFSVIGWFKVVETYSLQGEPSRYPRRDLRRGKHTGHVEVLLPKPLPLPTPMMPAVAQPPPAGADVPAVGRKRAGAGELCATSRVAVHLSWGEPHAGTGLDVMELAEPNVLHVMSTLAVDGQQESCLSVFRRKGT
uniref:Uncharacterized protein n=1 Tax=Chlamydomonas euryale TaxID=1486919 RepID=A0A7R9VBP2_9CHLO